LLELLVVITIIGILSSIVIVSMSGSTDSADIAKGKSYDQQIHALLGYEAVLDLNFNENAYNSCPDGKDVCDASGYNNNGDISNNEAAYILNPVGGYALSFDGINDRITIADSSSLDVREAITLTVWVNTDSYSGSKDILQKHYYMYFLRQTWLDNGILTFTLKIDGTYRSVSYNNPSELWDGSWHHIVGTWGGGAIKLYIDGNFVNQSSEYSGNIDTSGSALYIGYSASAAEYFKGLIGEIRIYAKALPATEIQKQYVQGLNNLLASQAITQTEYDKKNGKI